MNRESFSDWALSPERTLEERYGAEVLIEAVCSLPIPKLEEWRANYEAERLWRKERMLNPAYEPDYDEERVARTEARLADLKTWRAGHHDDRPLRDLSVLRFCPNLEELHVTNSETRDWSPLALVPKLATLWISDDIAHDLRVVGELSELKTLYLYLRSPWPDFTGWDRLRKLETLNFHGNPLALKAIGELPSVREAKIDHCYSYNVPIKSLGELPEMPELRKLHLINTWRLDGVERYPLLVNAEIYGYFDDLAPLAALPRLTHLLLSGGNYHSLAPLARLASLHWLRIRNEEPQDYGPLAETPRLHEVQVECCPASKLEVAAVNAGLSSWSDLFAAVEPRALPPLRLVLDKSEDSEPADDAASPENRDWRENSGMAKSEAVWFTREVNRRLGAVLGPGWGHLSERYARHPGGMHIDVYRMEDIDRLPAIVQALRELISQARFRWRCFLLVDTAHRYERDMDEIAQDGETGEDEEFDAEREREEWEYRQQQQRERRDFMERKHRLRLQQQLGTEINPEEFAAPKTPEEEDELAAAGDVDTAPAEYDLGTELHCLITVMESRCYVPEHSRGLGELLLEMKAEEPPEKESPPDAPAP